MLCQQHMHKHYEACPFGSESHCVCEVWNGFLNSFESSTRKNIIQSRLKLTEAESQRFVNADVLIYMEFHVWYFHLVLMLMFWTLCDVIWIVR